MTEATPARSPSIFPVQFAWLLVAGGLILYALYACATDQRIVHHTFEFGMLDPNKDIRVLNWRYGDSQKAIAQADKEYLAMGHIPQATNEGTFSPPGDSLYVKWRVISTGKVYEDTVDLKSRLPSDMNGKTIHFSIKGPQLYVYLISEHGHDPKGPDCPVRLYRDYGCTELYPDHWKNF
jgi:hypothetical protein